MKNTYIIIGLLSTLLACQGSYSQQVQNQSATECASRLKNTKEIQILDVRTDEEYNDSHLASAMHINVYDAQFEQKAASLDKNKAVLVYCLAGGRSARAAQILASMGFSYVINMQDGIGGWVGAGLPVEKGRARTPSITKAAFDAKFGQGNHVLIYVGTPWCPPCLKMKPEVEKLKKLLTNLTVINLDGELDLEIMQGLKVQGFPHVLYFKGGREVLRYSGYTTAEKIVKDIETN